MKPVCLLTGASGRLGQLFCQTYARDYEIAAVCNTRRPNVPSQHFSVFDPLNPSVHFEENDHKVFTIQCDLLQEKACEHAVSAALARFGRVDVLINAAAFSLWASLVASQALLDSADRQFELNAIVPVRLAAQLVRHCWRDRADENRKVNRNIVNVSSLAGSKLFEGRGQSIYAASKAALNVLTLHMAEEFRPFNIRVNAIAPDSLPSLVSTEEVICGIHQLVTGKSTGTVVEVTPKRPPRLNDPLEELN